MAPMKAMKAVAAMKAAMKAMKGKAGAAPAKVKNTRVQKKPAGNVRRRTQARSMKFLIRTEGRWSLAPSEGSSGVQPRGRSGTYRLDTVSGQMLSDKTKVGSLSIRAIGDKDELELPAGPLGSFDFEICIGEVMKQIQSPSNAGAYFVLPSQMNAAEYPHYAPEAIVRDVNDYRWDRTAGPRGQLSGHPAVAQFLLDNASTSARKGGINTVREMLRSLRTESTYVRPQSDVSKEVKRVLNDFKLQNGYLAVPKLISMLSAKTGMEVRNTVRQVLEKHLAKLRTVAVLDVPTRGLGHDLLQWSSSKHRVNLIYASAVPVNAYNNETKSSQHLLLQRVVSSLLLRGAYYGAMKLALQKATKEWKTRKSSRPMRKAVIYLLPLGGGVFNNPFRDIVTAMVEAVHLVSVFCKKAGSDAPSLKDLLTIRILAWEGRPEEADEIRELLKELGQKCHDAGGGAEQEEENGDALRDDAEAEADPTASMEV